MEAPAHHPNYYTEIATQVSGGLLFGTLIYVGCGGKIPGLFEPPNPTATTVFNDTKPTTGLDLLYGLNVNTTLPPHGDYSAVEVEKTVCFADTLGDLTIKFKLANEVKVTLRPHNNYYYAVEVEDNVCYAGKLGDLEIKPTLRPHNNYYAVEVEGSVCYADKLGDLENKFGLVNEVKRASLAERPFRSFVRALYNSLVSGRTSRFVRILRSDSMKQLAFSVAITYAAILAVLVSILLVKKLLRHVCESIMQEVKGELKKESLRHRRELATSTAFIVSRLENQDKAIKDLEEAISTFKDLEEVIATVSEDVYGMQASLRSVFYKSHRTLLLDQASMNRKLTTNIHDINVQLTSFDKHIAGSDGEISDLRRSIVTAMRKYSTLNLEANNAYAQKTSSIINDDVAGIMGAFSDTVSLEMRWNQDQIAQLKKRVEWLTLGRQTRQ
jgi:regulator of replication initiation timing